jgi:Adenylate and Guanylate cyclase catalytic domain
LIFSVVFHYQEFIFVTFVKHFVDLEPFQVFELLETIYGAFDELAKKRGIFKVETVG